MRLHRRKLAVAALLSCAPTQAFAADAVGTAASAGIPSPLSAVAPISPAPGPNILGTTAQQIRAARFSSNAQHAFADATSSPLMQRLVAPARSMNRAQQLAYVQSRVSTNIRWVSDTTQWGQHDYWASASETLAHAAGDDEDRAMVKLQALKALGFNQSDLFLTLARDRVGGPMTVVTARLNGRYFVLDDTGGAPFAVESRSFEFQPVISFSSNGVWLHVRPAAMPTKASGLIAARR